VTTLTFFVDCDNTILDNDAVKLDMAERMRAELPAPLPTRLWELYEDVRRDLDVIDFYETFARLDAEFPDQATAIRSARATIMAWDFRPRLVAGGMETLAHLSGMGTTVILSDGDPVFQGGKIAQCGASAAVGGRVVLCAHKEEYLPSVMARYPADRFVLVDDKPGILMRAKAAHGERMTTVLVRQGKYAHDPQHAADDAPDVAVDELRALLRFSARDFAASGAAPPVGGRTR
jgi:FMN phosphatase YigB (HAD superfamily)